MEAHKEQSLASSALDNLRTRLLDLTSRNRLINFHNPKGSSLRVVDELPDTLSDMLISEKELRFIAVPEPTERELIKAGYLIRDSETGVLSKAIESPSAEKWAKYLGISTSYDVPKQSEGAAHSKHYSLDIQTLLYPHELEARLKKLASAAQSAVQETGANILYIAFGFLEWFENNEDKNARLAPLYLLPVQINKGRFNSTNSTYEYTMCTTGEGIIPNLSLREKLRADFSLALPDLDEELLPEDYLELIESTILKSKPEWRIRRFISLGLFNFSKLLMYLDLDPKSWPENSLLEHKVVNGFLNGSSEEESAEASLGFSAEHLIDEIQDIHNQFPLISDADSSQHSALIDALEGKNLVIEGPPGTGKSQTITNLIAAALFRGKKVLFVAEKMAALEVVKGRLDDAGLGDFCLELHSHKTQKRRVLDDLKLRLDKRGGYRSPAAIKVEIDRYEELKSQLSNYAQKINSTWAKTELTLHTILCAATRYRDEVTIDAEQLHPSTDGKSFTPLIQRRLTEHAEQFKSVYCNLLSGMGHSEKLNSHPWFGLNSTTLQHFDIPKVLKSLEAWQSGICDLKLTVDLLSEKVGEENSFCSYGLDEVKKLINQINKIPELDGSELLDALPKLSGAQLAVAIDALQVYKELKSSVKCISEYALKGAIHPNISIEEFKDAKVNAQNKVLGSTLLDELITLIDELGIFITDVPQLFESYEQVNKDLGLTNKKRIPFHSDGLKDFQILLELLDDLPQKCIELRSACFENQELDTLLPELERHFSRLIPLRESLSECYDLDKLNSSEKLKAIRHDLAKKDFFFWISPDWWGARAELKSLSREPSVKFKKLYENLDSAIRFVSNRECLRSNPKYEEALDELYSELDTNLNALIDTRKWYKRVREKFGTGLGRRAAIGNALVSLPNHAFTTLLTSSVNGLKAGIDEVNTMLTRAGKLLNSDVPLNNKKLDLFAEIDLLIEFYQQLKTTIETLEKLSAEDDQSMDELAHRVDNVFGYYDSIQRWRKLNIVSSIFSQQLNLTENVELNDPQSEKIFERTIKLSQSIFEGVNELSIRTFFAQNPSEESFELIKSVINKIEKQLEESEQYQEKFMEYVCLNISEWTSELGCSLQQLIKRNISASSNEDSLSNWLDYLQQRELMRNDGLSNLVRAAEIGDLTPNQFMSGFYLGVYDKLAREVLDSDKGLAFFNGRSHEDIQRNFALYDKRLKKLQSEAIAFQVDKSEVPYGYDAARVKDKTDLALVKWECDKKTKHIPLRQLVKRAGKALLGLKPCFMMGPMSVSQYLEPGKLNFDLVIMDEASQIKPQDALGTIARGSQTIVVGDPKQLPPTSFFDRAIDEDRSGDEALGVEESESILDATLPMFQARRLRWHYRSQHESLISFSNHSFYDDDLILFPSPNKASEQFGVKYRRLKNGTFVNRKNMEEIRVIADSVREHILSRPNESIGVVAMNSEQQQHIETAIETLSKQDIQFQQALTINISEKEPLFVKNLENVQGDERDVILISMTYGPSEVGGRVYQRFGPINSDVGWRRLNVLFTRSKKRMHIFSSMDSDDIVVHETSSRGVIALRNFLRYCETGLLGRITGKTGKEPDSEFEVAVIRELNRAGFECEPQVGESGFYIDIAVLDPGRPGRYLMGIECDGATYHSAKSARDRDRLRQEILERLGWRIRRIWSTDWFKNPKAQIAIIIRELNTLKTSTESRIQDRGRETDEINSIVVKAEEIENTVQAMNKSATTLEQKLKNFDEQVIRLELPDTPPNKRLLRAGMIESLLEYMPINRAEFLELIPSYIRSATSSEEGKFLDQVLEIIELNI